MCSLKDSQNCSYNLCFCIHHACFSMILNDDIEDIEKPDGISLPTFVVNEVLGLILHPSAFSIKHSGSA